MSILMRSSPGTVIGLPHLSSVTAPPRVEQHTAATTTTTTTAATTVATVATAMRVLGDRGSMDEVKSINRGIRASGRIFREKLKRLFCALDL